MSTENINTINTATAAASSAQTTKARVVSAIQSASAKSGVDFTYLLNKAMQESSLNPSAKSSKSSATGLFQFIDQTWLKTVKENGDAYGLSEAASKITVGSDGVARVANDADKKAILALRTDPEVSANMAAELAKTNKEQLEKQVSGKVGATEMYLAHFLGAGGASSFLNELKSNPNAKAADILPQAASANPSVFYDKTTGAAKSVSEIYSKFAQKFDATADKVLGATQVASAAKASTASVSSVASATSAQSNKATETLLANDMVFASLAGGSRQSIGSATASSGGISLSNGVTLGTSASSPFATMMLAQMDMESFGAEAKSSATKSEKSDDERRKSALDTLASVS